MICIPISGTWKLPNAYFHSRNNSQISCYILIQHTVFSPKNQNKWEKRKPQTLK